jgi:CheY-like chemotaxis protein
MNTTTLQAQGQENRIITLLVVDDSRMSRQMIKRQVAARRPDWKIIEAQNGEEALRMAAQFLPLYISLDVNMPIKSGLEVAKDIKGDPNCRIVIMTANIQDATRDAAGKLNVGFCEKPIVDISVDKMIYYFENGVAMSDELAANLALPEPATAAPQPVINGAAAAAEAAATAIEQASAAAAVAGVQSASNASQASGEGSHV